MNSSKKLKVRRWPARQPLFSNGNLSEIVFVTVCTRARRPLLNAPDVHRLLRRTWEDSHQWLVGRYVILPDHIHLFCSPADEHPENVKAWVAWWKGCTASNWPRRDENPVWQTECWDRQLRSGESYNAKWRYTRENPVRHGCAATAEDWPYQGELNSFLWHDP